MSDADYENSNESNDTVGSDGIFLRGADRRRFDYVMRSVRENSLSLALSSDSDGVLDHYGRMVLARLRKTAGLQVEVFLPQNTEQLLERFNQILVGISLEDSRKTEGSPAPRRVLIAHDAKAIGKREMQLLARLVQDFPGSNVSLVLLVDRAGMQLHERTLDGFGQRLLRWPVEPPTRTEGESLLRAARAAGFEVEVKKVLAATGFAELKVASRQKKDDPAEQDSAQSRFEAQLALARRERREQEAAASPAGGHAPDNRINLDGRTEPTLDGAFAGAGALPVPPPQPDEPVPPARSRLSTFLRWTLASVLMLLVSAAVVVVLFAPKLPPHVVRSPLVQQVLPPWAIEMLTSFMAAPPAAPVPTPDPVPASVPAAAADSADKSAMNADSAAPAGAPADASKPAVDKANLPKPEATPADAARALPGSPKADTKSEPSKADAPKAEATKAEAQKTEVPKAEIPKSDLTKAGTPKPGESKPDTAKPDKAKADAPKADESKADATKPGGSKQELAKAEPARPTSRTEALAPRSERGVDQLVRNAPAGSFFVQHVSLGSMAEAQEWRAQYRALAQAKIVAVNTQDKGVKFAVVSGPFATRKAAETFAAREGVPPEPWLRPLKSLQSALLAAGR